MPNAADNLVKKYPTREKQLRGPVYKYLLKRSPFRKTDQDLYMAIFYPDYRGVPPTKIFPSDVRRDNPGIKTPQDYINLVNRAKGRVALKPGEEAALAEISDKLGLSRDSLYKMIYFESTWDPLARNPRSGARGLIQFMPSTARWMGFKDSINVMTVLALLGGAWYFLRRKK
jgi:hypothetical protein